MYYMIKNKDNQYITRKSLYSDLSLTDNKNFAYTHDTEIEAKTVIRYLEEIGFKDLEVVIS